MSSTCLISMTGEDTVSVVNCRRHRGKEIDIGQASNPARGQPSEIPHEPFIALVFSFNTALAIIQYFAAD